MLSATTRGNTRVLFTSATPAPTSLTATFEGDANDNSNVFTNVNPSYVVSFAAANHTSGGAKVVRMNQTYPVGPSKSLKVYAGDKVDLEVWAYHENGSGYGTTSTGLAAMITAVAGAFGGVSGGGGESGAIYSGVNSGLTGYGLGGNPGDTQPAAYLNYILFDQSYKVQTMGWLRVPASSFFSKQQMLISNIQVKEAGYLFAYLSYEDQSNNYVQFDDFKITHTKSNVLQYNEYYPFGLNAGASWTRENVTGNNFLYNEANEQNTLTGMYDLFFRNYEPALGRFHQVDPLADKYSSHSTFSYGFNDPLFWNDPLGAEPDDQDKKNAAAASESFARADLYFHQMYAPTTGEEGSGMYGSVFTRYGPGNSLGEAWFDGMRTELESARNGDANALARYASTYGEKFSGTVDYFSYNSMWSAQFQDGAVTGYTSYSYSNLGGYITEYPVAAGNDRQGEANSYPNGPFYQLPNEPAREPFGTLEYFWTGGIENGLKYDRQGRPMVRVTVGMGPEFIGGPLSGTSGLIKTYSKLHQVTKGWRGLIQAHHIVEVRHLKNLGLSISQAPAIVLSRVKHAEITKALQTLLPTGYTYSRTQIMNAYKQVYTEFPEWIEAAAKYLGH